MSGVLNSLWGTLKNAVAQASYIAFTQFTSPFIAGYPFSAAGFGTRYAAPTIPTGFRGQPSSHFTNDGQVWVVPWNDNPTFARRWVAYNFSSAGFAGTTYSMPSTFIAQTVNYLTWNNAGTYLATTYGASPFIAAYPFTNGVGFGTNVANPAVLPTAILNMIIFNQTDTAVFAASSNATGRVNAYVWSNATGFGTKYANPVGGAGNNMLGIAFNKTDPTIIANSSNLQIIQWPWIDGTGFGTVYANAFTAPTVNLNAYSDMDNAGTFWTTSLQNTPWAVAHPWNVGTGLGTKFSDPVGFTAVSITSSSIDNSGTNVIYGGRTTTAPTPFLGAWPISASTGYGTKYADPVGMTTTTYPVGTAFF